MSSPNKLNTTHQVLLKLISNSLFDTKHTFQDNNIDWDSVIKESVLQSVAIIAFAGIKKAEEIPSKTYCYFWKTALSISTKSLHIHGNHAVIDKLFCENNIDYSILKGCSSAYYYPRPDYRSMGDVDFMIKEEDYAKTNSLLLQNGFNRWSKNTKHHIVYTKKNIHIELHLQPAGVPDKGKYSNVLKDFFADIFEKNEKVRNLVDFNKPSHFHHGLILLCHTYHHLLSEGIGLRHLCDWAVFVNSFSDEEFKDMFEEKLKKASLWKFARLLSLTAVHYLGLPYREWMGECEEGFTYSLICDIIEGGNFGHKDKERYSQGSIISNKGEDGISKNMPAQFITWANSVIETKWPKAKKIRILIPLGWIIFGGRYAIKMLFGKRKNIVSKKIVVKAKSRKEIYSNFDIFKD